MKIPRDSSCMTVQQTVEYFWVNIWCIWIWSQNCRNTLLLHTVDQLVRKAKIETLCVYPTRDQIYTGWRDIRLWKLGCASRGYCLKFSEIRTILWNPNRTLASSPAIVLGNMVGKVNEGMCVIENRLLIGFEHGTLVGKPQLQPLTGALLSGSPPDGKPQLN